MNIEKRDFQVELKADPANPRKLRGYAAMFEKPSADLGGFTETIRKGAFKRSLDGGQDVLALAHHNSEKVLGRRSAGTLSISEDDTGLIVEITPANTTAGNDIIEDVRVGNIKGMSFGFVTNKDSWSSDRRKRELIDVELHEVSAVAWPAYPDTTIALRGRPSAEAGQPMPTEPAPDLEALKRLQSLRFRLIALKA
jgi:HK97 family phage prohead protease